MQPSTMWTRYFQSEYAPARFDLMMTLLTCRMNEQYAVWQTLNPGYRQMFRDAGIKVDEQLMEDIMGSRGFVRIR